MLKTEKFQKKCAEGISNGIERIRTHGEDADKKGWLVGIKHARFACRRIPVDTPITVRAENTFTFEGFREIRGSAHIDEKTVAEVILQVVQAEPETPERTVTS